MAYFVQYIIELRLAPVFLYKSGEPNNGWQRGAGPNLNKCQG